VRFCNNPPRSRARLDANAGVGPNKRTITDPQVLNPAGSSRTNRQPMAMQEPAIRDRVILVARRAAAAGFHGNIVVTSVNRAVGDEIIPSRRIDPVRVVGVAR